MSDLCCKDVSIRVNPSGVIDCSTEDPIWTDGHTDVNNAAYAPGTGYLLALRLNDAETATIFSKYDDFNNEMVDVASVLEYMRSGVVYDSSAFRFVCASAATVYTFDPVTQTTNNPMPTGAIDAIKFVYVSAKSKTYGQFQVGGNWWMGEIDLLTNTCTMLGLLSTFWSNMTYSPITDSLYGTTGGNSLKRFSLNTNSETTVAAVQAEDCGWDSDRDLLVCFGTKITEVDTATEIATVTNDSATTWNYSTSKHPVYCSSIHKFYVTGSNMDIIGTPYNIVYSYDTEDQRVQDVYHDYGYYGVFPIDDTLMFAAIYASQNNEEAEGSNGFRKLCVTGFLDPYLYFKCEDGTEAGFLPGWSPFDPNDITYAEEERNGQDQRTLAWAYQTIYTPLPGFIDNGWTMSGGGGVTNYPFPLATTGPNLAWFDLLFDYDFTMRMWFRPNVNPTFFNDLVLFGDMFSLVWGWGTGDPMGITFEWWTEGLNNGTPYSATATTVRGANWHRLIWWYKRGVEVGLKIDNDPSVTTPAPIVAIYGSAPGIDLMGDNATHDEFAIWKGIVLTEEEMEQDWNEGRGCTWSQETGWEYIDPPEPP